jgi:uncharacterized coiled-coil DUF342 family protein
LTEGQQIMIAGAVAVWINAARKPLEEEIVYLKSYIEGQDDSFDVMMEAKRKVEQQLLAAQEERDAANKRARQYHAEMCDVIEKNDSLNKQLLVNPPSLEALERYKLEVEIAMAAQWGLAPNV